MTPITAKSAGLSVAACKYCPARIVWLLTPSGNKMPVDADSLAVVDLEAPHRVVVLPDKADQQLYRRDRGAVVGSEGLIVAVPHWATCPGREQAREDARSRRERLGEG